MKHISDDEWEAIFLAQEREREQEEREIFEQYLRADGGKPEPSPENLSGIPFSGQLERRLPKSMVLAVDASLDLHLKTKHESLVALETFFRNAVLSGDRLLLIITGKGHHSEQKGVLREFVRKWLRRDGRHRILWYADAPRKMGGTGAFVVRLKPVAREK
ncbi:MAG: Smr/MutS family protein [Acidobacteria bacterium]|nr:Smr/MutS family protein [Acidobacteriota bacterium]